MPGVGGRGPCAQGGAPHFEPTLVVRKAIGSIDTMRINADELVPTPYQQLATYIHDNAKKIVVMYMDAHNKFVPRTREGPAQGLCMRVEVIYTNPVDVDRDPDNVQPGDVKQGTLVVSKRHCREWYDQRDWDFDVLLRHLRAEKVLRGSRGDTRQSLGKGVPWESTANERVFKIDMLACPVLRDMAFDGPREHLEVVGGREHTPAGQTGR